MRKIYYLLACLLAFLNGRGESTDSLLIEQEIQYRNPNAEEVFFVWGINDWSPQVNNLWPEGTYSKKNMLYTPMKLIDGIFTVNLKVKYGTQLDYAFWITKGPRGVASDVWDVNSNPKDYHTVVFNNNITLIKSNIEVRTKEPLSILDYSGTLFITAFILFLGWIILKRIKYKQVELNYHPFSTIIISAGVLLLALFLARTSVAWLSWDFYYRPFSTLPQMLWVTLYDQLYVVTITLFFLSLIYIFRKRQKVQTLITWTFLGIALITVIAGILNIKVVDILGRPFNYRWFYYSDFLRSSDAKSAVDANVTTGYVLKVTGVCISFILICFLMINFTELFFRKFRFKKIALFVLICLNIGYAALAGNALKRYNFNEDRLSNPVAVFLQSVNPFSSTPELFTMDVPDSLKINRINRNGTFRKLNSGIKNVILVVLESTPAEYIQPYDTLYKITPELNQFSEHAVVFDNIYAHAPATNKSMVSLMGSVYPWLSYNSVTQEFPYVNIPTISSELKNYGYRTAFFSSADNRFQRAGEFLSVRKFDKISDCRNLECAVRFEEVDHESEPLDGINDECTGDELVSWIMKDTTKPFFGMMWTYQTHYPYFNYGTEKSITTEPDLNRYLNAVNHSDKVVGSIIKKLKENDLYNSTLIVIVGDHGEAFGRHNQTTHASRIYEENLHIPCIIINPSLQHERKTNIGGTIDIAPTIMSLLNLPVPQIWQGQSLFSANRTNRTYFFSPWSDYLFGYREDNMKYIFNATKDVMEIYNLEKDPFEENNLSSLGADEDNLSYLKLAAWVQYQNQFMEEVLKDSKYAKK